jgi:hypothetical protein
VTDRIQRGETDFFSGEPLRALSTLVFSDNVDLQRSASLTFAEITERGMLISKVDVSVYQKPLWEKSHLCDLPFDPSLTFPLLFC